MDEKARLLLNADRLHTTELGAIRIKRNLSLETGDVVAWCRDRLEAPDSTVTRRGKNWYIRGAGWEITVNAHSATIITAHRK